MFYIVFVLGALKIFVLENTLKMEKQAIYFIPDISGYTNFVTHTEIEHGKHIISELLEILLDNVIIDLELAEIEGDALFMYTQKIPEFDVLIQQSKLMLHKFRSHLALYQSNRICNCKACVTAPDLKLKFIVHYGKIDFMRVRKIVKPYGEDVVKVHRLLKNSLPSNQYLLVTKCLVKFYNIDLKNKYPSFKKGEDYYDFNQLHYYYDDYTSTAVEQNEPEETSLNDIAFELPKLSYKAYTSLPIEEAHSIISSFELRNKWYALIDYLIYDDYRVNRGGSMHNCISGSQVFNVKTLNPKLIKGDYVYGETTTDIPNLSHFSIHFSLSRHNDKTKIAVKAFFEYSTTDTQLQQEIFNTLDHDLKETKRLLAMLCDAHAEKSSGEATQTMYSKIC